MLATAIECNTEAGAQYATPRDKSEQNQRSFVAVGGSRDVQRLTTELRRHERKHAIVVLHSNAQDSYATNHRPRGSR